MSTIKKINSFKAAIFVILGIGVLVFVNSGQQATAVTEAELRAETERIQAEIDANEAYLEELEAQEHTLRNKIRAIEIEIQNANERIRLTNLEINRLTQEIKSTETELERQKGLLAESIKALYKEGNVTTLELLASSNSYSDFINQQEYLSRLKAAIQDSAQEVAELKSQLEDDKKQQLELKEELQGQKLALEAKKQEQDRLLAETQGQEAKYQALLADLEDQRLQAQANLEAFLAAGNFVSLGWVNAGDTIGYVGSTGYSFGNHLHFEVRLGLDNPVDPVSSYKWYQSFESFEVNELINGYLWPVPQVTVVSGGQAYGCQYFISYLTSCPNGGWLHAGLDIPAPAGSIVRATASGNIILRGNDGDGYGNKVVIDHGGGVFSVYAHLLD